MDYTKTFAISAAGMSAERLRVEVAAANLANANTAQAPGAPAFEPMRVVVRNGLSGGLGLPASSFAEQVEQALDTGAMGAAVFPEATAEPTEQPPRLVLDPGHPQADERGFVAYPGVDAAAEMMGLMGALRSYESNVAAMNAAKAMALKALEIGGTT